VPDLRAGEGDIGDTSPKIPGKKSRKKEKTKRRKKKNKNQCRKSGKRE